MPPQPPPLTPRPGSLLAGGRYKLVRELGAGGNGVVWLALHCGMGVETVIKFPKQWSQTSDVSHAQLQQEARSLAAFSSRHPNIVNILDVGEMYGRPFVVMQLMRQGSLSDFCPGASRAHEVGRLGTSLQWLRLIADALDFVHREDLVHRDVKPANVLLDDSYSAYLADFGLASTIGGGEIRSAGVFGSLAYMAPELLRGMNAQPASDQFALAVTAFEFLTGAHLFPGPTVAEVISTQEKNWSRWAVARPKELAAEPWAVIARAVSESPTSRFRCCREFAESLCEAWGNAGAPAARAHPPAPTDTHRAPDETLSAPALRNHRPPPPPTPSVPPSRKITLSKVLRDLEGPVGDS